MSASRPSAASIIDEFWSRRPRPRRRRPTSPVTLGNTTGGINATLDTRRHHPGHRDRARASPRPTSTSRCGSATGSRRAAGARPSTSRDITGTTYRFTGLEPGTYRVRAARTGARAGVLPRRLRRGRGRRPGRGAEHDHDREHGRWPRRPTISGTVTSVGGRCRALSGRESWCSARPPGPTVGSGRTTRRPRPTPAATTRRPCPRAPTGCASATPTTSPSGTTAAPRPAAPPS